MKGFALFLAFILFTGSSLNDARKANRAYENGNYQEAAELYRAAIADDPNNAKLHFNLGNALVKMGNTEEAETAFSRYKSLVEQPADESLADYNTGKMLADMEMYEEALDYFKEALKKNPDDLDARHNYELALQKQKEQQQENQEQQSDSDDDNQENEEEQNSQNDQDQQNENQDQSQNENQQQNPQDQQGEDEQQPTPIDMTEQEAENILDALKQLERELLENRKKESTQAQSGNDKDW
ncbi:MAG: tetratricopeptide repeat protein [Balneolaceae bacterium]